jgi:hypothetical protein
MSNKRVPLYERLPEIYRIKDAEQEHPYQLKNYLSLVEQVFGDIHKNIESLYHDLFIESCDKWVIPYIGDLLGVSHLKGDSWTLREDVANTIALRRRKGTKYAIELLTYGLTKWAAHVVELRENMVWNQHLNHQRPDKGGLPPYSLSSVTRFTPIRGRTITLRDPAMLSLINKPFDPFSHIADLKPPAFGNIRYNLPNIAIFLWRLSAYRVRVSRPVSRRVYSRNVWIDLTKYPNAAALIARFDVHPIGEPVRLFNTHRFNPDKRPPIVAQIDETPGPILMARLSEKSPAGNPRAYVAIETYDESDPKLESLNISDVGIQLHLPESEFSGEVWPKPNEPQIWSIRGANLLYWEACLVPPINNREVVIDPNIGRIVIGVNNEDEGNALVDHMLLTYTYGDVGPVGAHPISRPSVPMEWNGETVVAKNVNWHEDANGLGKELDDIHMKQSPVVIEIEDSMTHELDIGSIQGRIPEDGGDNLRLNKSLMIRASDGQRPVIKLKKPLRFRPMDVSKAGNLTLCLEGLYLTRDESFPLGEPLIARAALNSLEIKDCTLDPGGFKKLDGTRAPIHPSMRLREPYGFANVDEEEAFNQTPEIILRRTIAGPLLIDRGYRLFLSDSIIDAGGVALLFSIRLESQPDLPDLLDNSDGGTIPNVLQQIFTNNGISLSSDAIVEGQNPLWLITDKIQTTYTLRKDEDQLNIYGVGFAVSGTEQLAKKWGPETRVRKVTFFGRMRVDRINGRGGIWVHSLEVLNNQVGCIKFSYFSGKGDRLPQNHGCVKGTEASLRFVSEIFGQPEYGQLAHTSDFRIRERGPNDDAMGAFNFLLEAHKWRNLQIRFREFMPVGVRPLLIPVT